MYKITKDKKRVVDYENRVVGFIIDERFSQYKCDKYYRVGLTPLELEKVSEVMQRSGIGIRANYK
tara:strand:+ start:896 stop:1090 length:195 start_codon:yes stop_codon:yes gene_type:complete